MIKHKTLNGEIVHPSIIPSYGVHQVQLVSNLAWTTNEQWNEFRKKPPQPGPIGAADCMKSSVAWRTGPRASTLAPATNLTLSPIQRSSSQRAVLHLPTASIISLGHRYSSTRNKLRDLVPTTSERLHARQQHTDGDRAVTVNGRHHWWRCGW